MRDIISTESKTIDLRCNAVNLRRNAMCVSTREEYNYHAREYAHYLGNCPFIKPLFISSTFAR